MLVLIHSFVAVGVLVALTHRSSDLLGTGMVLSPADRSILPSHSLFVARLIHQSQPLLHGLRIMDWSTA
jgi:hypothetical protein